MDELIEQGATINDGLNEQHGEYSATFFDFPVNVFFSRRIGLVEGQPQPIVGGGKLTGQAGPFDTGALYVRTAETDSQNAEDFLVGRVRRRILQQAVRENDGIPSRRSSRQRSSRRRCWCFRRPASLDEAPDEKGGPANEVHARQSKENERQEEHAPPACAS